TVRLLGREPEDIAPGVHSSSAAVQATYRLASRNRIWTPSRILIVRARVHSKCGEHRGSHIPGTDGIRLRIRANPIGGAKDAAAQNAGARHHDRVGRGPMLPTG